MTYKIFLLDTNQFLARVCGFFRKDSKNLLISRTNPNLFPMVNHALKQLISAVCRNINILYGVPCRMSQHTFRGTHNENNACINYHFVLLCFNILHYLIRPKRSFVSFYFRCDRDKGKTIVESLQLYHLGYCKLLMSDTVIF